VLLLIALEQTGIMARIAFAVDRGFHRLGYTARRCAVPAWIGCNVPALSAIGPTRTGVSGWWLRLLVYICAMFARSAIILAIAGKYLGAAAVLAIFALAMLVIAVYRTRAAIALSAHRSSQVQEIPPYAWPRWRTLLRETWLRTQDILTIVIGRSWSAGASCWRFLAILVRTASSTRYSHPLHTGGSGCRWCSACPSSSGCCGRTVVADVYQALGGFEIDHYLNAIQLVTFVLLSRSMYRAFRHLR